MNRRRMPVAVSSIALAALVSSCNSPRAIDLATERFPEAQAEVERTLGELLRAAERKDLERVEALHLYGPQFSKWAGGSAERLDAEATRRSEREGIEGAESMKLAAENLKIDVFGATAVATFVMAHEAVVAGQRSTARVKATLVWVRVSAGWKIAHEHFSALPPAR